MSKDITDVDKYKPTKAEEKLLEVLLDPNSIGMTITDICKEAGISRQKYYNATSKDGFNELVKDASIDLIKGKISHVINATYQNALDPKGHQDRKLLLTMLNIYSDKVEHSGDMDFSIKVKWADDD